MYPVYGPSVLPVRLASTTLELLRHPFAFTQTNLLSPEQFIKEAKKRGVHLELAELELLHKHRVLQPFYEIHNRRVASPFKATFSISSRSTALQNVHIALADGRLSDPAERRYTRWPDRRSRRSLWFSYHQLQVVRHIPYIQARMKGRPVAGQVEWTLDPLSKHMRDSFARQRSLAVVLEALAPRYRPRVVGSFLSGWGDDEDEPWRFVNNDETLPALEALGVPIGSFVSQADQLLAEAGQFDPLGAWNRVTRIGNSRRWEDLRFDALVAHEFRVAAETLLCFVEDQALQGRAEPLPELSGMYRQPQHDRLRVDSRERSEVVMDFDLSNNPALVLAVEGETEYEIVKRVLDFVGFSRSSWRIAVVNLDGVGGDMNLLARAVAVPHLDPDGHSGARILSPLTALMVVVDPEGKYQTHRDRESVRTRMIQSVVDSLPTPLRTDSMRSNLEFLLHVRSWPAEFEFAHWNDQEIARALQTISAPAARLTTDDLRHRLKSHREASDSIRSLWSNWKPKPSKVKLAIELWPDLESRILSSADSEEIPILKVLDEVVEITHRTYGVNYMGTRQRS